jgi:shikimate kinase
MTIPHHPQSAQSNNSHAPGSNQPPLKHPKVLEARALVLTGFMGVGKTSVGKILADELNRTFHDSDDLVLEACGETPQTLIATGREKEFREIEARVIAESLGSPSGQTLVLALGGGALENPATREIVLTKAFLVHLFVPWKLLSREIESLAIQRPLLAERTLDEVHQLYLSRLDSYRTAHLEVTSSRRGALQDAQTVLDALMAL